MRFATRAAVLLLVCALQGGSLAALQDTSQVFERLPVTAGRSRILTTDFDVTRIAVTNPAIADAAVITPREILIDSKAPGLVSLILWGDGRRVQYDVVVEPGISNLQQQLETIFPGEDIRVSATEEAIVLSGHTSTNDVAMRAAEIAQASSSKMKVINLMQRPGGPDTQQVMLQVRFAEVERTAIEQLGATLAAIRSGFDARTTGLPNNPGNPTVKDSPQEGQTLTFSDFLNLYFFARQEGIGGVIRALQQHGQFKSLAEPNLIAYNGQEASFLAGGEFPIPLVQGNTGQVTVQFKEFGVRLTFKPVISGDIIRLTVRPEVSSLDFANGLSLGGYTVPALKTRRADTTVELADGQSFAIAGLLQDDTSENRAGVPILSSLPIIGAFFKSKDDSSKRTELMVLITPHLVRPLEPAELPPLPGTKDSQANPGQGLGGLLNGGGGFVDAPTPGAAATAGGTRP